MVSDRQQTIRNTHYDNHSFKRYKRERFKNPVKKKHKRHERNYVLNLI